MGTGEQPSPKHVGQQNPSGVLRLSGIPRNRDFGHRRMRLPKEIQILWRVALPLLRNDLRVAFDEHVLWTVAAAGGEIPNHRLVHDDHMFGFRLDLLLGFWILILAHYRTLHSPSSQSVNELLRKIHPLPLGEGRV